MDLTLSLWYQSRRLSIWCHTDVAGPPFEWESSFILMGCGLILTRNWPTWHGHGNIVTFLAISWCGSGLIQTWTYTHQYCIWPLYASALTLGYWPYHYWDKGRRLNALPYLNVKVALSSHLSSLVIIVPNLILTWTSSQRWVSGLILFCKQFHRDRNRISFLAVWNSSS